MIPLELYIKHYNVIYNDNDRFQEIVHAIFNKLKIEYNGKQRFGLFINDNIIISLSRRVLVLVLYKNN